jgi:hypothetical protein
LAANLYPTGNITNTIFPSLFVTLSRYQLPKKKKKTVLPSPFLTKALPFINQLLHQKHNQSSVFGRRDFRKDGEEGKHEGEGIEILSYLV